MVMIGFRPFVTISLCIIVSAFLFQSVPGISAETSLERALQEDIEEITITGTRSLSLLRKDIERAETLQFSLFNDLVDDKEFQILCRKVDSTTSRIRKRECEPRFMKTARIKTRSRMQAFSDIRSPILASQQSAGATFALDRFSNNDLTRQERRQFRKLDDLMLELGNENKALADSLIATHQARQIYQAAQERRARK